MKICFLAYLLKRKNKLKSSLRTIAGVARIGRNPVQISADSGIDARRIWLGTAVAEGDDAGQAKDAIGHDQWTATVAL